MKLLLIILDLRLPDIRLRLELIGKLLLQRHGLLLLVKFPSSIQITFVVPIGSTRECSRYLRNLASQLVDQDAGILRIIDRNHNTLNAALTNLIGEVRAPLRPASGSELSLRIPS